MNEEVQNRISTGIGPMTDRVLNTLMDRLSSGDFKEKLTDKIVDPITHIINEKVKPYIYVSVIMYFIVIILLVLIIYLIVKKH